MYKEGSLCPLHKVFWYSREPFFVPLMSLVIHLLCSFRPCLCVCTSESVCPCMLMWIWITCVCVCVCLCVSECSSGCQVIYAVHWRMAPMNKQHQCHLETFERRENTRGQWDEEKWGKRKWEWLTREGRKGRDDTRWRDWKKMRWEQRTARGKEVTMIPTNYWPEGMLI